MADIYYPDEQTLNQLLSCPQGFQIKFSEDQTATLFLKFDMAKLIAIIKGCPLQIRIANPFYETVPYFLYILDNPKQPFWAKSTNVVINNSIHREVHQLINVKKLRIALFNEMTAPIHGFATELNDYASTFDIWISNLDNPDPALRSKDLIIDLKNTDHSNEATFTSILNTFSTTDLSSPFQSVINIGDYLVNGKHGYSQEESIKNIFAAHFEVNKELFISPKTENGTEFCDFVVLLERSYLIIESKFVISSKRTNEATQIKKGVRQLLRAKIDIYGKTINLHDKVLQKEILDRKYPLNVLLYNGSINLDSKKCDAWLVKDNKMHLPMFMPIETLTQFLNSVYIQSPENFKSNLELTLYRLFDQYYFDENQPDFLIFDHLNFTFTQ